MGSHNQNGAVLKYYKYSLEKGLYKNLFLLYRNLSLLLIVLILSRPLIFYRDFHPMSNQDMPLRDIA